MQPFFNTHVGREKLVRLIQYFLLFFIPAMTDRKARLPESRQAALAHLIEKLQIVYKQCSLTRKVLRFGYQVPWLIGILRRFREHQKSPVKMILIQTLADIFHICYLTFDHP